MHYPPLIFYSMCLVIFMTCKICGYFCVIISYLCSVWSYYQLFACIVHLLVHTRIQNLVGSLWHLSDTIQHHFCVNFILFTLVSDVRTLSGIYNVQSGILLYSYMFYPSPFYTSNILSKLNSKRRQFLYCHCGQGIFSGCFVAGIDVQVFFEIINMQILRIHAFKIDFVDLYWLIWEQFTSFEIIYYTPATKMRGIQSFSKLRTTFTTEIAKK